MRTLMMAGNWAQHAFIERSAPDDDFKNSITCINTRYNRRCFNDGYHVVHHLKPALHYSEMPAEFHQNSERYGQKDAIVFDGYDFFQVWLLLMSGQKQKLANAFVRLPGAPERSESEVLKLLNQRLAAFES
jgi:fatty acid desaturase